MGNSRATRRPAGRRRQRALVRVPVENGVEKELESITEPTRNGDTLSTEIWLLILEELGQITDSISSYRLISKRFDDIVTPIAFRNSVLDKTFLNTADKRRTVSLRIASLVKSHARRLVVRKYDLELEWDKAAEFIKECRSLRDLEWNPGHADFNTTFPPAVRTVLDVDKPHVRLHLKAFYTKYFTARGVSRRSPDTSLVPHSNLISFTSSCPSWTSDMPSLQKFLVASRMLQNLDLTPSTYGSSNYTEFTVEGGRLPPIKRLALGSIYFISAQDLAKIWDFSQLESLHIHRTSNHAFLRGVPGHLVSAIRKLCVETTVGLKKPPPHDGFIPFRIMRDFIGEIKELVDVHLVCQAPSEMIPVLSLHSKTLRSLRLEDARFLEPTMDLTALMSLQTSLPNLEELQLNLSFLARNAKGVDAEESVYAHFDDSHWSTQKHLLHAIAGCHNLRKLTIEPQSTMQEAGTKCRKPFCDEIVKELTSLKKGRSFTEIIIHWKLRLGTTFIEKNRSITMKYSWNFYEEMNCQITRGKNETRY